MSLLASLNEVQQLTTIKVSHDKRFTCQAHRICRLAEGWFETVNRAA